MNTPGNDKARRILLVDDDPGLLRLLTIRLRAEGFEVSGVTNATEALASAATFRPDLVITDLRMDGMDGIALLSELQRRWPGLRVILITAHGTIPDAVQATQRGAYSFLTKPIDKDELLEQVNKALELSGMTAAGEDWSAEIITRSPVMEEVLRQAGMAASIDDPILIFGESGTGKELLARAIHRASPRNAKGFVTVGCRAAEEDIDAEMFGSSVGAMERANGGTLMLDEIGELPLPLQGKLLRALERKRVTGPSGEAVSVDVRLISTTQAELSDAVDDGHFREDLFYRLGEVKLGMPTLADRREDIPLLVSHFLSELTDQKVYAPDAMELLVTTTWPGNVRQLHNVVKSNVTLCRTQVISARFVEQALGVQPDTLPSYAEAREEFTRNYLIQLLQITGGNVSQAARLAKRNRTDFYKLLARHDVNPDNFKRR